MHAESSWSGIKWVARTVINSRCLAHAGWRPTECSDVVNFNTTSVRFFQGTVVGLKEGLRLAVADMNLLLAKRPIRARRYIIGPEWKLD